MEIAARQQQQRRQLLTTDLKKDENIFSPS
jgi:hypothetical protein